MFSNFVVETALFDTVGHKMLTYLLTTSSLQEVTLLKDNNLEDIIGVPCHPDKKILQPWVARFFLYCTG